MNIPNILSLFRLVLVPCFALVFLSESPYASLLAGMIYMAAALTDVLDGYLARKWQQITKLGRVLDPLADKLLIMTALVCLSMKRVLPWYMCGIFLVKDLIMLVSGMFMVNRMNDVIPSNIFGKGVAFLLSASIATALLFGDVLTKKLPHLFDIVFLVAAVLAIAALVVYGISYLRCLKKNEIVLHEQTGRLRS